ncbi:MAG: hypothetical protein DRP82_05285, partial [Planctomycetota bacterium]
LDLLRRAAKGEKDARIKLFRTVSAFAANKRGSSSFLILGIREGKPEQRTLTEAEKNFLKHAFNDYPENFLNPPAVVEYAIQPLDFKGSDDGELVVIRVLGKETPHRCELDGRCYIREGAKTRPMTELEIRLLKEKEERAREEHPEDLKGRISALESRFLRLEETVLSLTDTVRATGASHEVAETIKRDDREEAMRKIAGERGQFDVYLTQAFDAVKKGDRQAAERLLKEVIEETTNLPELKAKALFLYAALDDEKALASILFLRGTVWAEKGDFDRAIEDYDRAIELNPKLAEAYYNRGNAWAMKGEYDRAIEDWTKVIELDPKFALAYTNRGLAWDEKGDYDKAIEDYNKAIELKELLPDEGAQAFYNRGLAWVHKDDYDKAIEDFTRAIELNPKFAEAFYNRGLAWAHKGNYDRAIEDYNKAIELNSSDAKAFVARGLAWDQKGEHDKAIEDYNKAIELNPNCAEAFYNRGLAWAHKGNYDKAIKDYSKAIELKELLPDKGAGAFNNRGVAWAEKGDYDKAIADFSKAIELNPNDAEVFYNRGNAWVHKGNYDKAIEDYTRAIELNPKYEEAFNNRGNAWVRKGNYDKAIEDFNKAIDLNLNYAEAFNNRGVVWVHKGNYDKAIEDYNKAIELAPNDAETFYNRGLAWALKGNYDRAIKDFNKAIELNPQSPSPRLLKAALLAHKGEYDEALAALENIQTELPESIIQGVRSAIEKWRKIEESVRLTVERLKKDERVKLLLVYGSVGRLWDDFERFFRPAPGDIDIIIVVDGFQSRLDAMKYVFKLRGDVPFPTDMSVYTADMWEKMRKDLFIRQEVFPTMKVLIGEERYAKGEQR